MKRAISVTLRDDNLLWLKGQAAATTGGNVSEVLDRLGAPRRRPAGRGVVVGRRPRRRRRGRRRARAAARRGGGRAGSGRAAGAGPPGPPGPPPSPPPPPPSPFTHPPPLPTSCFLV